MKEQTPTDNTDPRHAACGNLSFLLSVIRCGEQLSDDEEAGIRRTMQRLDDAMKAETLSPPEAQGSRPDGVSLIAVERARQVSAEGWTPAHDDAHRFGEIVTAAACYAVHASHQTRGGSTFDQEDVIRSRWPWEPRWWKPSADPIRNLVKAGALIAAEIDRLLRLDPAHLESQGTASETVRLRQAILWALGEGDPWEPEPPAAGRFWWRKELRTRAGLDGTASAAGRAPDDWDEFAVAAFCEGFSALTSMKGADLAECWLWSHVRLQLDHMGRNVVDFDSRFASGKAEAAPTSRTPDFAYYQRLRQTPQYAEAERESAAAGFTVTTVKRAPEMAAKKIEQLRGLISWFTLRYEIEKAEAAPPHAPLSEQIPEPTHAFTDADYLAILERVRAFERWRIEKGLPLPVSTPSPGQGSRT